jgi:tetratricopeptide (TPR) repeat protein
MREAFMLISALAVGCGSAASPPVAPEARTAAHDLPAVPPGAEAVSLLGAPLAPPDLDPAERAKREQELEAARADAQRAPGDVDAAIWLGRRLGRLHRYREAVEVFSDAIAGHPDDARLYRFRGHRYLTVRQLDRAVADLARAAELRAGRADEPEPDTEPAPDGKPTSSLHFNIWYHLGLAHYLRGDYAQAARAYRECARTVATDDGRVAVSYWLYLTLARMDETAEAQRLLEPITPTMTIVENGAYHRLLLLFKDRSPLPEPADPIDRATLGYGRAAGATCRVSPAECRAALREVVDGPMWPAFGHLAAEAELARLDGGRTDR